MRRTSQTALCVLAALPALISCSSISRYAAYPSNPYPEYRKIAILPFLNYTDESVDGEKIAQIFSSQMTRFPGYYPIRPNLVEQVRKKNNLTISSPDEAIQCARLLDADAVVVGVITEYKPYYPPRIGIAMQMFVARRPLETPLDVEKLMQSGKPFQLSRTDANRTLVVLEHIFDGESHVIRDKLRAYGRVHGTPEDFNPEETFLRVTEKFTEFACDEMIRKMIEFCEMVDLEGGKESEAHEKDRPSPCQEAPPCDSKKRRDLFGRVR